jgi:hypothetical protein
MKRNRNRKGSLRKHSLSLAALAVVVLLIVLYRRSDPDTQPGAFFGKAIATGVLIMTKHIYEKGSAERQSAVGGSGMAGRALAHSVSSGHRHRLGGGIQGYGPEQSMGTSGWQHRFRMDPDPGVGSDDQAPDGGWVQDALTAGRAAYPLSPIVPIDGSNRSFNLTPPSRRY